MNENLSLVRILQICDSLFPVGSFTLSNGLEAYVQKGVISNDSGLEDYLKSYITLLPYNELGAAAIAFSADEKTLIRLDEIYTAAKCPSEIRLGSQRVAKRFFKQDFGGESVKLYKNLVSKGTCFGHQSIAWGLFMRDCKADILQGLNIYGYSICSAIVTNCVKLVPLSQVSGQRILSNNLEKISLAAEKAMHISLNEIGISGAGFELRAMQHERLYSRQYMS